MSYKQNINTLLPLTPLPIMNILNGKVDFLEKNYLKMEERIDLFKYFLMKYYITRKNEKTLENGKQILLNSLFNQRLYIYRKNDLNIRLLQIIVTLLKKVNENDMKKYCPNHSINDLTKIKDLFLDLERTSTNTTLNRRKTDNI